MVRRSPWKYQASGHRLMKLEFNSNNLVSCRYRRKKKKTKDQGLIVELHNKDLDVCSAIKVGLVFSFQCMAEWQTKDTDESFKFVWMWNQWVDSLTERLSCSTSVKQKI